MKLLILICLSNPKNLKIVNTHYFIIWLIFSLLILHFAVVTLIQAQSLLEFVININYKNKLLCIYPNMSAEAN